MFEKIFGFIGDVRQELGKVSWPTRDELLGSTYVVIIISGILAVFIFGVDRVLTAVIHLFLG